MEFIVNLLYDLKIPAVLQVVSYLKWLLLETPAWDFGIQTGLF